MYVLTAAEMAELDRRTIDEVGLPGAVLMENAGRGAARALLARFGREPKRVAIVCGTGNNGGDGFVIGRLLRALGWEVATALLGTQERVRGDAAVHLRAFLGSGGAVTEVLDEKSLSAWSESNGSVDVVVDAIFGTGLRAEVVGVPRCAIEWLDGLAAPVVAVDVPSGVDASSGRVLGRAPRCALTVTFGFPKLGHVLPPGCELAGDVRVVDIGIPNRLLETSEPSVRWLSASAMARLVPFRPRQGHKGTFGHLLVVAGSAGLTGAGALTSLASLRAGVGLVTLAMPASAASSRDERSPEIMTAAIADGGRGFFGLESLDALVALASGNQAVALGPGLGRASETRELVLRLVAELDVPMVVDADALVALAGDPAVLDRAPAPRILTPHPGEMGMLVGASAAEVQGDRLAMARRFAAAHRCIVVLKGAGTVVAHPDGRAAINSTGNPGMSTGGMGDVLTGVVGALLAQRMEPGAAAELAVYLHGAAGDRLTDAVGRSGLLASEVARELPAARDDLDLGRGPFVAPRIQWLEAP